MNSKIVFIQTLVPLLAQMAKSPDKGLAAEASEELSKKTKELASLQRTAANEEKEAA